jgi:hypothetical protein
LSRDKSPEIGKSFPLVPANPSNKRVVRERGKEAGETMKCQRRLFCRLTRYVLLFQNHHCVQPNGMCTQAFFEGDEAMEAMINEGGAIETQRTTQADTQTTLIHVEDEPLLAPQAIGGSEASGKRGGREEPRLHTILEARR